MSENSNGQSEVVGPRAPRRFGRIAVRLMCAEPLVEPVSLDVEGCHLERSRSADGTVTARVLDESGVCLGTAVIYPSAHGDRFYGRYSRSDASYCYGAQLETAPAARGRGLGRQLTRIARAIAFEEGGRGIKSLVAPDNDVSLRIHAREEFRAVLEARGIRMGDRVLWLSRKDLDG